MRIRSTQALLQRHKNGIARLVVRGHCARIEQSGGGSETRRIPLREDLGRLEELTVQLDGLDVS